MFLSQARVERMTDAELKFLSGMLRELMNYIEDNDYEDLPYRPRMTAVCVWDRLDGTLDTVRWVRGYRPFFPQGMRNVIQ